MPIQSFLLQGDGAELGNALADVDKESLSALLLFSLGADHEKLTNAVLGLGSLGCPVYVTETYGILGFDIKEGRNLELMEKGRGQEYGCRGGDGGQGCVVVAFSGETHLASHEGVPAGASSAIVVTTGDAGKFAPTAECPVYVGGVTKECYVLSGKELRKIPWFSVATCGEAVGVVSVRDDISSATRDLLAKLPGTQKPSGAVAMFPCFTRGINEYDKNDVEPEAVSAALPGCRVFGMFAHGELGPSGFTGFCPPDPSSQACTQHSMTTTMSVFTTTGSA